MADIYMHSSLQENMPICRFHHYDFAKPEMKFSETLNLSRLIVLVVSCGICLFVYGGLRFTSLPNGLLTFLASPFVILIIISSWRYIHFSKAELNLFIVISCGCLAFGMFWKTYDGIGVSAGAISSAIIMALAYLGARAIVAVKAAYLLSSFAFLIVAVPAIISTAQGNALHLRDFFVGASENYVSSWLIITGAAMASAKYRATGKLVYFPFVLTALISFFLFTRGSITVSLLTLLIIVYLKFGFGRVFFLSLLVAIIGYQYINRTYGVLFDLIDSTKFGLRGMESPRWEMWNAYLRELDGVSFLIGVNPSCVSEISMFGGNPHSSLVRAHAYFGILALIVPLIMIPLVVWRVDRVHVFMLLVIVMRATTDILLVGTYLDIFFMMVLVNVLDSKISTAGMNVQIRKPYACPQMRRHEQKRLHWNSAAAGTQP